MNIYKKSFIFKATKFEEYQDGCCLSSGDCNINITAKVIDDESINFVLEGPIPVGMNTRFGLPILGTELGDVLDDRVQYGRLPDSMSWHDSYEPIVCNIFNTMTCIRFAMVEPLRIIEFYGAFKDVNGLRTKISGEGINKSRTCPWSKDYLSSLYAKVDNYCKLATLYTLKTEGQQASLDTMAAYNMFKYPVVYVFIHYHYGDFNDLKMEDWDISSYMMYVSMVKHFTQGMMDGMLEQTVFDFDNSNEIAPALIEICKEVIYIEDNF